MFNDGYVQKSSVEFLVYFLTCSVIYTEVLSSLELLFHFLDVLTHILDEEYAQEVLCGTICIFPHCFNTY
jgi:hypothetical protein